MFELSVALKYLVPRWRQLSVSIISMISVFVIALVVWLIVVFFSVTQGLETNWIQKLIALTAPIRVTPTEQYYKSYYYLSDSMSADSNYTLKTIGEKLGANQSDPYDPDFDQELPPHWPLPDYNLDGTLKDPVKNAFLAIESIPGLKAKDYEMTFATIKLNLERETNIETILSTDPEADKQPSSINQSAYLGSFDSDNPYLTHAMLPAEKKDIENLLYVNSLDNEEQHNRLKNIFQVVNIKELQTPKQGFRVSNDFLPEACSLDVCVIKIGKKLSAVYIPKDNASREKVLKKQFSSKSKVVPGRLRKRGQKLYLSVPNEAEVAINDRTALVLDGGVTLRTSLNSHSLDQANAIHEVAFDAETTIQGITLSGKVGYRELQLGTYELNPNDESPFWLYKDTLPSHLPSDMRLGDAVLLPKSFRNAGVLIGDRGHLSYQALTSSAIQEQRVPIYVAGFYDPGIFPMGSKFILANPNLVSMIRSSYPQDGNPLTNGINVRFDSLDDAAEIKNQIEQAFLDAGIDAYWKVETFREYELTKDFLQQIRSERNLFTLISTIIILVACSNIVSMLIILVNNKKMEIGILRSMGATSSSIAAIFGTCGIVMGLTGSIIGVGVAVLTLKNLQVLIDFISHLQGFQAFNPQFYGNTLPNEVSLDSLIFVMGATAATSLIAGIVPAVKACLMRPTAILRSE